MGPQSLWVLYGSVLKRASVKAFHNFLDKTLQQKRCPIQLEVGQMNIMMGWITMVLGILSGSILGLWAFNGPAPLPKGHEQYDSLPRRLVRLAHIAFFALPLICIVYGMHIDAAHLSLTLKQVGSWCMIICMLGVPTLLIGASFYLPIKYLEVIPVSCGFVALSIMAYGQLG